MNQCSPEGEISPDQPASGSRRPSPTMIFVVICLNVIEYTGIRIFAYPLGTFGPAFIASNLFLAVMLFLWLLHMLSNHRLAFLLAAVAAGAAPWATVLVVQVGNFSEASWFAGLAASYVLIALWAAARVILADYQA